MGLQRWIPTGKSDTNAKAEHLGMLQQGGEILMACFLMLFLQGWRFPHGYLTLRT